VGRSKLVLAPLAGAVLLGAPGVADTSTIAYTSLGTFSSHVWVMRGNGNEKDQVTAGSVVDLAPSLSPAGRRLVFVRRRADDRDDLFRVGIDGSGLLRLTRTRVAEADPTWSSAGGLIAFSAGRAVGSSEIVVLEPDGTGRRRLTRNSVDDIDPAWAPGGARLTFTRHVDGRNAEIYVIQADGTGLRRLTNRRGADDSPDWSSTGWIAYVRRLASGSAIRAVRPDGTRNHLVIRSTFELGAPTWSPRGARLVFEVWDGVDTELFRVSASSTGLRRLTRNSVADFGPVWGPGGGRIAFTRFSGDGNDVWTMLPDGSDKERLTSAARHEAVSDWGAGP